MLVVDPVMFVSDVLFGVWTWHSIVSPAGNAWLSCHPRICHCEGDDESPLITPCHCTGSLHFVHQACLQQWIKSSDTRCCELCKYEFIMETRLKPLRKVGGGHGLTQMSA